MASFNCIWSFKFEILAITSKGMFSWSTNKLKGISTWIMKTVQDLKVCHFRERLFGKVNIMLQLLNWAKSSWIDSVGRCLVECYFARQNCSQWTSRWSLNAWSKVVQQKLWKESQNLYGPLLNKHLFHWPQSKGFYHCLIRSHNRWNFISKKSHVIVICSISFLEKILQFGFFGFSFQYYCNFS